MRKKSIYQYALVAVILCLVSCKTKQTQIISIAENVPEIEKQDHLKSFEIIADLDILITETSGLETYNGQLITHNDSDAPAEIYLMDTLGMISTSTEFNQMKNIDWEDIAKSDTHLFIADIGNNYGNRKDLTIYKIRLTDIDNPDAPTELLELEYENQTIFERKNQNHPFDGEAIVYASGKLLLFSKDWLGFTTEVYQLEQEEGKQTLIGKQNIPIKGLVTGATFNGKSRIVLCGYNSGLEPFVAILKIGKSDDLTLIERINLPLENGAQIEAITYFNEEKGQETYYLTSEAVNIKLGEDEAKSSGQLYKMKLKSE